MRRLSRWALAVVSALAVWRLWTRRRRARDEPAVVVEPDPADELRRKLAETREETPADDAETAESLEERRARVHAKAEQATDAMREDET